MVTPNIRVANDFFHDSLDFLQRYRITLDSFYAVKSRRFKLFLDLRMAAECVLKAYAAYHLMNDLNREAVIRRAESYGHKIKSMAQAVESYVAEDTWAEFNPFVEPLNALPVGLRYRLDGMDFREMNESFYYQTIGSDTWLEKLHDATKRLTDELNERLMTHSRILSGSELMAAALEPQHNKYAKPAGKKPPKEA